MTAMYRIDGALAGWLSLLASVLVSRRNYVSMSGLDIRDLPTH